MKTILSISFVCFFAILSYTQHSLQTNANNVDATMCDHGLFFNDHTTSSPRYEVPVGSGNHVAYNSSFWMAGIETDSTFHSACNKYPGDYDFFAGPITDDYNSLYYTSNFNNAIWKVTRDQINFHVSNYTAFGYIPDSSISGWPGNGNVSEGVAEQLAPYVDVNNDQIYNPMDGDFPYIQGDQAVYTILNDEAGFHAQTGSDPFGIEVHAMFYQFQSADDLNNTTFLNTKIYNRRDTNYVNFMFGLWLDIDIGNFVDDYMGSDSTRSLIYGYNAVANDPGGSGQPGYGTNPPAFGAQFLSEPAGCALGYSSTTNEPIFADEIYVWMQGATMDGQLLITNPSPTKFIYSGNPFLGSGWNELTLSNTPGDRRVIISSTGSPLMSGDFLCYDVAFIFNQDAGNAIENVNELLSTADFIQNYYDNNIQPCNQIFLESEIYNKENKILIYPNPSNGSFTIQTDSAVKISVIDFTGKLIISDILPDENGLLNLDLQNGYYILAVESETGVSYHQIEVLR